MKSAWIDLRGCAAELATAVVEESSHIGIETVVLDDPELAGKVPPTVQKAAVVTGETPTALVDRLVDVVDLLIVEHGIAEKFEGSGRVCAPVSWSRCWTSRAWTSPAGSPTSRS